MITPRLADELFCGGFGGAVGVFVGQPFDFVKVRLQTLGGTKYKGLMDCVTQTLKHEGIGGMFRGVTPPVMNSFALNAIAFGGYESGKRLLEGRVDSPAWKTFLAGSYAGLLQVVALVPSDLVKCRLQMDRATGAGEYTGPLDCAAKVVRQEGPFGLFRGTTITAIRDTPTFGLYFLCYEVLERELPRQSPWFGETATTLVSGGVCGTVTWGLAFVSHSVDSTPQDQPCIQSPSTLADILCASFMHRSHSIRSRRMSRQCRPLHLQRSVMRLRSLDASSRSTGLATSTVVLLHACSVHFLLTP